jgi:hypothetical protein
VPKTRLLSRTFPSGIANRGLLWEDPVIPLGETA